MNTKSANRILFGVITVLLIPLIFFVLDYYFDSRTQNELSGKIERSEAAIQEKLDNAVSSEDVKILVDTLNREKTNADSEVKESWSRNVESEVNYTFDSPFILRFPDGRRFVDTSAGVIDVRDNELLEDGYEIVSIYDFQDGRYVLVQLSVTGGTIGDFYTFQLVEDGEVHTLLTGQGEGVPGIQPDLTIDVASWGYMYSDKRTYWNCRFALDPDSLRIASAVLLNVSGYIPPDLERNELDLCDPI